MTEIMINGTPVPIHFGLGAIREFTRDGKREFSNALSGQIGDSLDSLIELIGIGLNQGAKKTKSGKRYTSEDVEFMIDDNPDLISHAMKAFAQSIETLSDRLGDLADEGNAERPKTRSPRATKAGRTQGTK